MKRSPPNELVAYTTFDCSSSILPKYSHFAPVQYQLKKSNELLNELKQVETCDATPAVEALSAVFTKAQKNKSLQKIKMKFPSIFNPEPKYDSKKLQQVIKIVNATQLSILLEIIKSIDKMDSHVLPMLQIDFSSFNKVLIKILKNYGDQAAILLPGCLEKILDYINTNPSAYKIHTLQLVLEHEKLVTNLYLPKLMDALLERVDNPMIMKVLINPVTMHDQIVENVLLNYEHINSNSVRM